MSDKYFSVMLLLWDALGVPATRVPVDATAWARYILPPIVCNLAVAALAVTPQTRTIRIALWPVFALLAFRAVCSVDMSLGKPERKMLDVYFVSSMYQTTIRTFDWASTREPFVRHLRPGHSQPSTIMDALDLVTNFRGYGWNWSHGLYVPGETRPTNRTAFAFHTFLSAIVHVFIFGVAHRAILSFIRVGSITSGFTFFDDTLPFILRLVRASIISALTATMTYTSLQTGYDLFTVLGILLLGQDPAQWPPAFDAPWRATSVSDFWGRRWHQWDRLGFLCLGCYPLSIFLGRTGIVLDAFLASSLTHDILLLMPYNKIETWRMLVGFGMIGFGILAEWAFCWWTGKRVGGMVGWVWTMTWLLLWGNVMLDGFARAGGLDHWSPIDSVQPMVERVVRGFDDWLHEIG